MRKMMMRAATFAAAMVTAATVFAAAPVSVFAAETAPTKSVTSVSTGVSRYMGGDFTISDCDTGSVSFYEPVTLINNTGKAIKNIYIAPSAVSGWGNDILGDSGVMMDGDIADASFYVYGNYTKYDIYVINFDGTSDVFGNYDFSNAPLDGFILEFDGNSAPIVF